MSTGSSLLDQLASGDGGDYRLKPDEFAVIRTYLLEQNFNFAYYPADSLLQVKKGALIRGSAATWFQGWVAELWGSELEGGFVITLGLLEAVRGDYVNAAKTPSAALYVRDRIWPTIVVECGYGEVYDDLKRGTALLLEGSEGRIGKAILVHLDNIGDSGTVETGFVEVWEYDRQLGSAKRSGGRFNIYPPPKSRQTQALRFTAGDVLRNRFDEEKFASFENRDDILPPLRLEPLRELVDAMAKRQFVQDTGGYDDEAERQR